MEIISSQWMEYKNGLWDAYAVGGRDGMQDKNATLIFEARTQHRLGKRLEESTEGDEGGLKDNGRMMHKPVLF